MKGIPPHKLERPNNYKNFDKDDFWDFAISKCLEEMYAVAQPPADYNEILKLAKDKKEQKDTPFFQQHYLSEQEYTCIVNKYLDMLNIKSVWGDYTDIMIEYLKNGGYKNIYVSRDGDNPGYRSYEDVEPIINQIGEEAANKVFEYMNLCKNFYKFNRDESAFRFTISNVAPTSNAKSVKEFWKSQGVDIEIEERSEDDIFAIHYEGVMPEELKEYNEELEALEKYYEQH